MLAHDLYIVGRHRMRDTSHEQSRPVSEFASASKVCLVPVQGPERGLRWLLKDRRTYQGSRRCASKNTGFSPARTGLGRRTHQIVMPQPLASTSYHQCHHLLRGVELTQIVPPRDLAHAGRQAIARHLVVRPRVSALDHPAERVNGVGVWLAADILANSRIECLGLVANALLCRLLWPWGSGPRSGAGTVRCGVGASRSVVSNRAGVRCGR